MMPKNSSLAALLPFTILIITVLVLFYRVFSESLIWALPALQFIPWQRFSAAQLSMGELPLWNPFNGAGSPLIANYQSAVFYLPNLIALIAVFREDSRWYGVSGVLHLLWAGVGMWLFLGALRLPLLGRAIGTLAYALNGAMIARFFTPPMVNVAAWLPFLVFGVERLIRYGRLRDVPLMAAVTGMLLLAGHAQWAYYGLVLTGLYFVWRIDPFPLNRDTLQRVTRIGILFIVSISLAIGLAAIQLAPTAELQRASQRSGGVDEAFALNFSYELALLPTLFNANFYGSPGNGTYTIKGAYFETAVYIGFLPLILALITVGHWLRFRRRLRTQNAADPDLQISTRLIPFFALVTLVVILFALGKNSPVWVFLFRYVPTFNLFQAPTRWLILAAFSLSVLAALGTPFWKAYPPAKIRERLWLAGSIGVTGIGLVLMVGVGGALSNGVFVTGLLSAICAGLFVAQPSTAKMRAWRGWRVALLVFIAADLGVAYGGLHPTIPATFYQPRPPLPYRTYRFEKPLNDELFDQYLTFDDYSLIVRQAAAFRDENYPNLNLLDRGDSFNIFEPLRTAWIEKYTDLLNDHPAPNLYTAAGITTDPKNPAPKAWLVPIAVGSGDAFKSIADPSWNPSQRVFLEGNAPTFSGQATGTVKRLVDQPTKVTFEVEVNGDRSTQGVLVIAETWYPGWQAKINGADTPIYRANGAFRAVIVSGGVQQVEFTYDPPIIKVGMIVTGIAGVAWLILAGISYLPRPRTRK
jgi:hypothetical protein